MDQFSEAAVYLAHSLAIKKLLFGPAHPEVEIAHVRWNSCGIVPISTLLTQTRGRWSVESEQLKESLPLVQCIVNEKIENGYSVLLTEDGRSGCNDVIEIRAGATTAGSAAHFG